jgi:hypothetical protein
MYCYKGSKIVSGSGDSSSGHGNGCGSAGNSGSSSGSSSSLDVDTGSLSSMHVMQSFTIHQCCCDVFALQMKEQTMTQHHVEHGIHEGNQGNKQYP